MIIVNNVIKVECDTLEELENYIKEKQEIPEIIIISGYQFLRNNCYRNTCNELFEYWEVNNSEPSKLIYEFRITNGKFYHDKKFDVNSYNFLKHEKITKNI